MLAARAAEAASFVSYIGQHGDPHPLGLVNIILIFLVAPVGVFLILAAICLRPQRTSGAARYRPGRSWPYAPTWFGTAEPLAPDGEADSPGHGGASGSW